MLSNNFGHLTHAYVNTDYGAQGRTVENVMVVATAKSYPAVNKRGFYVDVSRGRGTVTIHTDDKRGLRAAVERCNPRLSATELAAKPKPQRWKRMRETLARMRLNTLVAAKAAAQELATALRPKELAHER
jgi:ATP-dependent exoDNAse (exonuclease V) alpha subunit